ncbi:MAG: SCO family protein [Leptothrix sp. (in: b-proteobacteria)]
MSGSNSSAPGSAVTPPNLPDQPLGLSVHGLPDPGQTETAPERTRVGRLKMLLVLLICASPVMASYFTYYVIRPDGRTNYSTLLSTPVYLPEASQLSLTDLQQQPVDPRSLRGQWLLVVVADGACNATCEKLLYAQRQLRETLGRDKDRVDRVWLVTGDQPPRPELLPALDQATVLRALPSQVAAWLQPEPGHQLNEHLYLVDPMGYWMMRVPVDFEPNKVKRDLERLLRAAASWDKPGRGPL